MTGEAGAHTNRPDLVAVGGYDTKYAVHALRLGVQGVEPHRAYLRSVRRGEVALAEVLDAIAEAEAGRRLRRQPHAGSPGQDARPGEP
jgi:hypothetical protein